ncbi:MAG: rod shape-determining protein RodA [Micavibrio aeruginosavorus]|uniref:Peptidoglycan glycosyltransferase RodA n=1 Tax=Micavibrio aeruginosavorus TaxID=349221 RepID=A0A2W4ZS80_9BACT|nr:MAG: rod shape-determining protein RodA [Micavibrio aeruginosavorus]
MSGDGSILQRLKYVNWGLLFLITLFSSIGFTALYSAAGGSFEPWAEKQMVRYAVFAVGAVIISLIDIRIWYKLAYPIYGVCLVLLLIVEVMGHIGMGAQRWINLGFIQVQPSELTKIAVVLALSRYFHSATSEDMKNWRFLLVGAMFLVGPFILVATQPDLGTSGVIVMAGVAMFWLAGAPVWIFAAGFAAFVAVVPAGYALLHNYKKKRVEIFLDPESDPLGAGYHITQSKIALGSGGWEGKGFLKGTQSHLNFLPEKQTDFIYTLWVEEWGLIGGIFVLLLVGAIVAYSAWISSRCRHGFGRMMAFGLGINFFIYAFINIAMVMGLIPVVGVPLVLVSYGGTAMMAVMIGFGLMMCCNVYKDAKLPRM